ncbi:hypothetical protein XU18_3517 [Perkinsela sp. CCAP 1560/4]|nr:hypothetical protein XU18_3517 [Perkinsela sp. CCAP 1560/4]|eukprot:KNH05546.1 hypothetical protein XU18_3517 [Perkinsela sp. CCAP 1560/4]
MSSSTGSARDPKRKPVSKYLTPTQPGKGEGLHPVLDPYIVTSPNVPSRKVYTNTNDETERRRIILQKYEKETLFFKKRLAEERIEEEFCNDQNKNAPYALRSSIKNLQSIVSEGEWPWVNILSASAGSNNHLKMSSSDTTKEEASKVDFLMAEKVSVEKENDLQETSFRSITAPSGSYFNELSQYTFPLTTWFAHFHPSHIPAVDNVYHNSFVAILLERAQPLIGNEQREDIRLDDYSCYEIFKSAFSEVLQLLSNTKEQVTLSIYAKKESLFQRFTTSADAEKTLCKSETHEFHSRVNYNNFRKSYAVSIANKTGLSKSSHECYVSAMLVNYGLCRKKCKEDTLEGTMKNQFLKTELSHDWRKTVEEYITELASCDGSLGSEIEALWMEYEKYFLIHEILKSAISAYFKVHIFPSMPVQSLSGSMKLLEEAGRNIEIRSLFSRFLDEVHRQKEVFLRSRNCKAQWDAVMGSDREQSFRSLSHGFAYPYSIFHDHKNIRHITTDMYAHQYSAYYMYILLRASHCLQFVHITPIRMYLLYEEEQYLKNRELKIRPWREGEFNHVESQERNRAMKESLTLESKQKPPSIGGVVSNYPGFLYSFFRSSCSTYDVIRFVQRLCFDHCAAKDYTEPTDFDTQQNRRQEIQMEIHNIAALHEAFDTFVFGADGVHSAILHNGKSKHLFPVDQICSSLKRMENYLKLTWDHESSTVELSPTDESIRKVKVFDLDKASGAPGENSELMQAMQYVERDVQQQLDVFVLLLTKIIDKSHALDQGAVKSEKTGIAHALMKSLQNHSITKKYFTKEHAEKIKTRSADKDEGYTLWEHQDDPVAACAQETNKQLLLFFALPRQVVGGFAERNISSVTKKNTLRVEAHKRILTSIPVVLQCEEILHALVKLWREIDPSILPPMGGASASLRGKEKLDAYNLLPSRKKKQATDKEVGDEKEMAQKLAVYATHGLLIKQEVRQTQRRLRYLIRLLCIANTSADFVTQENSPSQISGGIYGDHPTQCKKSEATYQFEHLDPIPDKIPRGTTVAVDGDTVWTGSDEKTAHMPNLPLQASTIASLCAHIACHLPQKSFSKSFSAHFTAPAIAFLRDFLVMEPLFREKVFQEHPNWGGESASAPSTSLHENSERSLENLKFLLGEVQDVIKDLHRIDNELVQQSEAESDASDCAQNHNATLLKVLQNSDYKHFFKNLSEAKKTDTDGRDSSVPYALQRSREIALAYPQGEKISAALRDLVKEQSEWPADSTPLLPDLTGNSPENTAEPTICAASFASLTEYLIESSIYEVSKNILSSALFLFLRSTYVPNHLQALFSKAFVNRIGSITEIFPNKSKEFGKISRPMQSHSRDALDKGTLYDNQPSPAEDTNSGAPHVDPGKKHVIVAEVASHMSYLDYNVFKKFDIAGSVQRYTDLQNRNVSLRVRLSDLEAPSHFNATTPLENEQSASSSDKSYPYKPLLSVHGIRRLRIVAGEKVGGQILKFDLDKYEKYQDNYEYGVNVLNQLVADSKKSELGEVEGVSGEYVPTVEVKVRSRSKGLAGSGREKMLESVIDWERIESTSTESYAKYVAKKTEKGASAYVGPQATWWKMKS